MIPLDVTNGEERRRTEASSSDPQKKKKLKNKTIREWKFSGDSNVPTIIQTVE